MAQRKKTERQLVTFSLNNTSYAIDLTFVTEVIDKRPTFKPPNAPDFIVGILALRELKLPVMNLRKLFGFATVDEEVEALRREFAKRKQDHLDWVAALEDACTNGTPFTKAHDPAQCAFGKWYAAYRTENANFGHFLERFDRPHRAIHAQAAPILALSRAGRVDEARERLKQLRSDEVRALLFLFDQATKHIEELALENFVILQVGGTKFGVVVDRVQSVMTCQAEQVAGLTLLSQEQVHFARDVLLLEENSAPTVLLEVGELAAVLGVAMGEAPVESAPELASA